MGEIVVSRTGEAYHMREKTSKSEISLQDNEPSYEDLRKSNSRDKNLHMATMAGTPGEALGAQTHFSNSPVGGRHFILRRLIGRWLSISEGAVHVVSMCSGRESPQLMKSAAATAKDELSGRPSTWLPSEWRTNPAAWGREQCARLRVVASRPVADQT